MAARIQQYCCCLAAFFMGLIIGHSPAQDSTSALKRHAASAQKSQAAGWQNRLKEQQHALMNYPARVCFIGDSLTEYWQHTGQKFWDSSLTPLKAINLGTAGDRTEHMLYRLQYLDFSRAKLTHIVLMAGANNLAQVPPDSPDDVLKAVQLMAGILKKKCPEAMIIVLGLPPNKSREDHPGLPKRVQETNQLLQASSWPEQVQFVSVDACFAQADGQWKPGMSLDGTHFSEQGYKVLAEKLLPLLPTKKT